MSGPSILEQIRIEALRLSDPKLSNPDMELWIARAYELERYITGAGQPSFEVPQQPSMSVVPPARTIPRKGPAPK